MDRACNPKADSKSAFEILTGEPIGKRFLGRPRRRWEDNIKMDHKDILVVAIRGIGFIRLRTMIFGGTL